MRAENNPSLSPHQIFKESKDDKSLAMLRKKEHKIVRQLKNRRLEIARLREGLRVADQVRSRTLKVDERKS